MWEKDWPLNSWIQLTSSFKVEWVSCINRNPSEFKLLLKYSIRFKRFLWDWINESNYLEIHNMGDKNNFIKGMIYEENVEKFKYKY